MRGIEWGRVRGLVLRPGPRRAITLAYFPEPAQDYELIGRASGGHGERVEDPDELPGALARALKIVKEERRQALLNVVCKKP